MKLLYAIIVSGLILIHPFRYSLANDNENRSDCDECDIASLTIVNPNDVEQLVALYHLKQDGQEKLIQAINQYLNQSYNQVLNSIYLSHVLHKDSLPENTLSRIDAFKKNDVDNSLPSFLLSYYYFKKKEYKASQRHLLKANQCPQYMDYTSARTRLTKSYLIKNNKTEFCAYRHSILTLTHFPVFLVNMSRDTAVVNNNEFKKALMVYAKKHEVHSKDFLSKMISFAAELNLTDKKNSPELYETINKKKVAYWNMLGRLNEAMDASDEEETLNYMKLVYNIGEINAADQFLSALKYKKGSGNGKK